MSLRPNAGQVAGADVVQLGQHPGVDDVAAGDLVAPVADGALGHLQPRGPAAQLAAVAAPRQAHAVPPGAGLQVLEVEAEDVVALDHVGIALADERASSPRAARARRAGRRARRGGSRWCRPGRRRRCGRPRAPRSGTRAPSPVTTSMSSAIRRRSPKRIPPNEVRPLASRYCWTGSGTKRYGAAGRSGARPLRCRLRSRAPSASDQAREARAPAQRAGRRPAARRRAAPGASATSAGSASSRKGVKGTTSVDGAIALAAPDTDAAAVTGEGEGDEPGSGIGAEEQGRVAQPAASSIGGR